MRQRLLSKCANSARWYTKYNKDTRLWEVVSEGNYKKKADAQFSSRFMAENYIVENLSKFQDIAEKKKERAPIGRIVKVKDKLYNTLDEEQAAQLAKIKLNKEHSEHMTRGRDKKYGLPKRDTTS